MKRSIPVILSLALLFGAFGVPASAEEAPDWKKEYLDFIVDDYNAIDGDERDMTTYQVMYVASSGVPFIYVSHGTTAGGGAFCYVDGDEAVTDRTAIVSFEYIEGSDAFFETGGRMGSYFNAVYALEDACVVSLGSGTYGGQYGTILEEDTGAVPVNAYNWNGEKVSREEYRREYLGLRDKYLTPEDEIIYVDGYGYGGWSYDEIIAWLMEQGGVSASGGTFSGVYTDMGMGEDLSSQVSFDSENQQYIFCLNTWEDWIIAEGSYTVDPDGIINCSVDWTLDCYGGLIDDTEGQSSMHFLASGDKLTILDEVVGYSTEFYRAGDGFTIHSDDGTGTVTGDSVRVRTGPGTEYSIFTACDTGDRVSIIGRSGDWYRIEYASPYGSIFRGFMRSDYIARD